MRFGGTLTADDAFALGFDHVALALGAGRPTVLDMPNGLARGVRTASDFLMALQLTGAAKTDSIANMQLRLPVVVIGGGLTAIDTATESLAYYPCRSRNSCGATKRMAREHGEAAARIAWNEEERAIADEFLSACARDPRRARTRRTREARAARILELLQSWGGVTIAYRRRLIDSPSYTLNHEEVEKALEEGIRFAEGLTPLRVEIDDMGHARALRVAVQTRGDDGEWTETGAGRAAGETILIAAGTQPNTVLAREDAPHFTLDGKYFRACDEDGRRRQRRKGDRQARTTCSVLLSRRDDGRFISYFGDVHPSFFGNVVKAMGSAKQGYPVVSRVLAEVEPASPSLTMPISRAAQRQSARDRARGRAADADDRRSRRARAARGAALPAGAVLPAAEFRNHVRCAAETPTGDGRPRADRRMGRSPSADWSRRSCSRWAARAICASLLKPGEPSC